MPTIAMPATVPRPAPPSADVGDPFCRGDLPAESEDDLEGDRPEPFPRWVSLDARTGRLVCPSLDLDVDEFVGRITRSRLVRVFGSGQGKHDENGQDKEESGGALCASENRRVADHGRPGRECAGCEDRRVCTPRWRIFWEAYHEEEPGSRLAFAHTLSAAGTVSFTRYSLALRREGLRPQEVLTRLSVEELRRPGAGVTHRRLRFEKIGLLISEKRGSLPHL